MIQCASCSTTMKLRTGKFGMFYYCPKSSQRVPHGTISKDLVDRYLAANLKNIAKVSQKDDRTLLKYLEDLDNNFEATPKTILDFFNDYSMKEDMEEDLFWADVIPRG